MATPRCTHASTPRVGEGRSTARMKLVDTPVVDSVPARAVVLYTGQRYAGAAASSPGRGEEGDSWVEEVGEVGEETPPASGCAWYGRR
jgi:hypothetical protein